MSSSMRQRDDLVAQVSMGRHIDAGPMQEEAFSKAPWLIELAILKLL